jgi:rRNA-processing protein FCF1
VRYLPLPVILDTNFIAIPAEFGIDIFSEAELLLERRLKFILLQSVVQEIEVKADEKNFRVAKALFDRCSIEEVSSSLNMLPVDDQLLEYTISINGILATNDRELRRKARKKGVPVLFLRGKKRLVLEGTPV